MDMSTLSKKDLKRCESFIMRNYTENEKVMLYNAYAEKYKLTPIMEWADMEIFLKKKSVWNILEMASYGDWKLEDQFVRINRKGYLESFYEMNEFLEEGEWIPILQGMGEVDIPRWVIETEGAYEGLKQNWLDIKKVKPAENQCVLIYGNGFEGEEDTYFDIYSAVIREIDKKPQMEFTWHNQPVGEVTHWIPFPPTPIENPAIWNDYRNRKPEIACKTEHSLQSVEVLVYADGFVAGGEKGIYRAYYVTYRTGQSEFLFWLDGDTLHGVTHWIPLPKCPEG